MNLTTAENYVTKLLSYIESIKSSESSMYSKSKSRLRDIANTCSQVVALISDILQDEELEHKDEGVSEFQDRSDSDMMDIVLSMKYEIDRLVRFVDKGSDNAGQIVDETVSNKSNSERISSNCRKQVLAQYHSVFQLMNKQTTKFRIINRCKLLLLNWFESTFINLPRSNPNFRYNIRRLSRWVMCIIISFSEHIRNNDIDDYILKFDEWIHSNTSNSVPYDVFQFSCMTDEQLASKVTTQALVVWDILLDSGMRNLCVSDKHMLYPKEDYLYEMCANLCPSNLDDYFYYENDVHRLADIGII